MPESCCAFFKWLSRAETERFADDQSQQCSVCALNLFTLGCVSRYTLAQWTSFRADVLASRCKELCLERSDGGGHVGVMLGDANEPGAVNYRELYQELDTLQVRPDKRQARYKRQAVFKLIDAVSTRLASVLTPVINDFTLTALT